MEWRDFGIVIGLRRLGETSVIAELMTREHGRHLGIVRGGRSRRMQPVLQPGNEVAAVWRARLEDQLGSYTLEPGDMHVAAALESALSLYGINFLCALFRLFAERDPHASAFQAGQLVLRYIADPEIGPALMARFELAILQELGFGLDLTSCALTGAAADLAYVSPKSGRAVSLTAGEPWRDRLFVLPTFLKPGARDVEPSRADVGAAFRLTGHFLQRDVLEPRGVSALEARSAYVALLTSEAPAAISSGVRKPDA